MPIMRNMAIKHKLMSVIMATCVVALLLAAVVEILHQWSVQRKETVDSISCYAEMIGDNCRAALAFDDADDASETLRSLQAESSIVFACIYTKDGKMLASYQHADVAGELSPLALRAEDHWFDDSYFKLFKEVRDNDDLIGTVYIQFSLGKMRDRLWLEAGALALVVVMCSLVAYLVSSKLQGIISKPILSLTEVAKAVSTKKEYSIRATGHSNDEVGLLIDSFNEMLEQIQQRDTQLVEVNENLETRVRERTADLTREITERKQAEEKLRETHQRLMEASHRAGMAEVATDVLHNVGNVLNSINVSANFVKNKVLNSKAENLKKVADMIKEHADDLGTFLTEDQRGRHIPIYLAEVARLIADEQADITEKLQSLTRNVEHVKEIVKTQQTYAGVGGVEVFARIRDVIEDAIQINSAGLKRHGVEFKFEVAELPEICIDKQRVLQILVNLVSNAKYALSKSENGEKTVTIRCHRHGEDRLRIEVTDNGVGIPQENISEIFRHGFTTKKDGHGFGLHSSALAAKEMNGSLTAQSEGLGHGATFTLELPFEPKAAGQCIPPRMSKNDAS